jgi:hypothetical protein
LTVNTCKYPLKLVLLLVRRQGAMRSFPALRQAQTSCRTTEQFQEVLLHSDAWPATRRAEDQDPTIKHCGPGGGCGRIAPPPRAASVSLRAPMGGPCCRALPKSSCECDQWRWTVVIPNPSTDRHGRPSTEIENRVSFDRQLEAELMAGASAPHGERSANMERCQGDP